MNEPVTHAHSHKVERLFQALNSAATGLDNAEAERRLLDYEPNEIKAHEGASIFKLVAKQFKSWMVVILVIAALISWFTEQHVDAWVIVVVIVISAAFGFFQEYKAEKAIDALRKQSVKSCKVIRNGQVKEVQVSSLVPGDVMVLEEGDYIAADARIFESKNLRTSEASLTGESMPVSKLNEVLDPNTPLAEQKNMVWKGCFIVGGHAHALVTGTGSNTALGNISVLLGGISNKRSHFLIKTDTLARQMAMIAIGSSVLLFLVAFFARDFGFTESLLIFIAALVAAIPEDLVAVISVVLAVGANRMARKNALIREFTATETLGAVTAILTDKTGTITQNKLVVRKIFTYGQGMIEVSGDGYEPSGTFKHNGVTIEPMMSAPLKKLMEVALLSNNSTIHRADDEASHELIGDPTEGALKVMAMKAGMGHDKMRIDDLPFDSSVKLRASLYQFDHQAEMMVVGAPEQLLERSARILGAHGEEVITAQTTDSIKERIDQLAASAHRVIGLAFKKYDNASIEVGDIHELVFVGMVGMVDPPREDVRDSIMQCKKAGIRVVMVTGDHINTAVSIARSTGILDHDSTDLRALTEQDLSKMNPAEFDAAVSSVSVFARLSPKMKLHIAERIQAAGHLIAMTGDGVNDAPALKRADVGISMGIMGTDVARMASDMVLADDNFATIVKAIEQGRVVFNNARQTSFFLVTTNLAESATLLLAILVGLPIPLTATQILWLNLVTDGVTDMALATEKGHGDLMASPPLNRHENILNRKIIPFLAINIVIMTSLAFMAFFYYIDQGIEKARTGVFIVMACTQLFNVYNLRSINLSIFKIGFFSNMYINLAVSGSVLLLILVTEWDYLADIFHFIPLSPIDFITWIGLSSVVLWAGEAYKWRQRNIQSAIHDTKTPKG